MNDNTHTGNDADRIEHLLRTIQETPSSEQCATCLDSLEQYIQSQLAREDYLAQFPETAKHLDLCEACAAAYADRYEAAYEALIQQLPAPNFDFLASNEPLSTKLSNAILQTAKQFRLQLSAELALLLQPPPELAVSRLGQARYQDVILSLTPEQLPQLDPPVPIHLTAYRDSEDFHRCLVEVKLAIPGKRWPQLGGYLVTLTLGETKVQQTSDPFGIAAFENIDVEMLEQIVVEVTLESS